MTDTTRHTDLSDVIGEASAYFRKRLHSWRHNAPEKRPKELRMAEVLLDALEGREVVREALRDCLEVLEHVHPDGTDFDLSVESAMQEARKALAGERS